MRFLKFTIENYRAITGPMVIDVGQNQLIPIIGINESGKTTILHAIFSFDFYNDDLNDNGRHLKDIANLYKTGSAIPLISAEIEVNPDELIEILKDIESEEYRAVVNSYRRKYKDFPYKIIITRNLYTLNYSIDVSIFNNITFNDVFAREILVNLPFILFFDDFRDSIEECIEIAKNENGKRSGCLPIIERLFRHTDKSFSVYSLGNLEERQRKSVLAKVKKLLNKTLTKEWQNFRLDDSDALEISIDYEKNQDTNREFIKLEIIETIAGGDEHYFYIRDRSKGFYWFFNFVMKLEFNPKVISDDDCNTIYLLDEPGSYLHASAQSKLCAKLRQLSEKNKVVYCTHSHYLLDPNNIPFSAIRVADKDENGNVQLIPIHEHTGNITDKRSAFQPVIDALEIKPFVFDLSYRHIVITEGIYDYYCIEMFKCDNSIGVLPSVGAESIQYYVSLMIAYRINFSALWDNDIAGRNAMQKAEKHFGKEVSEKHFFTLPLKRSGKDRILQNLFEGNDLRIIRDQLGISPKSSFEKTVVTLFYSGFRDSIIQSISRDTINNFAELINIITH